MDVKVSFPVAVLLADLLTPARTAAWSIESGVRCSTTDDFLTLTLRFSYKFLDIVQPRIAKLLSGQGRHSPLIKYGY